MHIVINHGNKTSNDRVLITHYYIIDHASPLEVTEQYTSQGIVIYLYDPKFLFLFSTCLSTIGEEEHNTYTPIKNGCS